MAVDLDFHSTNHLTATHKLHSSAARFPPQLARWAIERYSSPGDVVLDPMVGSGTTLVEALTSGRVPLGCDIDPLSRLIATAKATLVSPDRVAKASADLVGLLQSGELNTGWRPPQFSNKWFREDVADELAALRDAIPRTAGLDQDLLRLMWVVFSSIIVARTSVANARDVVHSRHHYRAWVDKPDVFGRYIEKLARAGKLMSELELSLQTLDGGAGPARIVGDDARSLACGEESVDLIVTSPPYCSAIDYPRAHQLALSWMQDVLHTSVEEYRDLAPKYIGTERAPLCEATDEQPLPPPLWSEADACVASLSHDRKRAWVLYRYLRDMQRVMTECSRVLRAGAHMVLVVCPSHVRKVHVPTHELLPRAPLLGPQRPFRVVDVHQRTISDRRRLMPYIENAFGPRMRLEYVVVLQKHTNA